MFSTVILLIWHDLAEYPLQNSRSKHNCIIVFSQILGGEEEGIVGQMTVSWPRIRVIGG